MHVAVLLLLLQQRRAGRRPGRLAARTLLLEPCHIGAGLAVPIHADEAVVENRLGAGYGPPGFFVLGVLD